ncbi:MAG: hypothetical protein M1820_008942 [Bogoriella megaspora]|nr:MAG: hypothetical protein M1820_008942 [Bogoriella megaspora]
MCAIIYNHNCGHSRFVLYSTPGGEGGCWCGKVTYFDVDDVCEHNQCTTTPVGVQISQSFELTPEPTSDLTSEEQIVVLNTERNILEQKCDRLTYEYLTAEHSWESQVELNSVEEKLRQNEAEMLGAIEGRFEEEIKRVEADILNLVRPYTLS